MGGTVLVQRGGGGGGTPGGSDTQVQFNDGGVFGASPNLAFDKVTGLLAAARIATSRLAIAQGTLTDPVLGIDHTVTWNDAGDTFVAQKLNVTDTASAAASKLIDLQLGGATYFDIRKDGYTRVRAVNGISPAYFDVTDTGDNVFFRVRNDVVELRAGFQDLLSGGDACNLTWGGTTTFFEMSNSSYMGFRPDDVGNASDVVLHRAGTLVLGLFGSNAFNSGMSLQFLEMTAPGNPPTGGGRMYLVDNGGKTEVLFKFDDGSTAQVCIQP